MLCPARGALCVVIRSRLTVPPVLHGQDGRFSTFGYVVDGNQLLQNIEVGDVIVDAKVTDGLENLQQPK